MKPKDAYTIIFQDEAVLALNKAAGIAVLPGRGRTESVIGLLAADPRLKGCKPLVVHRIDADTSGMLLIALTPQAQAALAKQFREHTVVKEYWALVRGMPLHESGSVDQAVGVDPHNPKRMMIKGDEPRMARTKWVIGQRYDGVSLVKVYPVTGRRHQIRVHLKAMGYPLAVDPLYGGTELKLSEFKKRYKLGKFAEERPLMSRLTLHARSITVTHPVTGAELTLEADLPKDFRSALAALDRWARRT